MTLPIPIFDYDVRYFKRCNYSKYELFQLQNQILSIISSGSIDIHKDLKTEIDELQIDLILRHCYHKKWIQRERLGVKVITKYHKIPIYRYFTKK